MRKTENGWVAETPEDSRMMEYFVIQNIKAEVAKQTYGLGQVITWEELSY